MSWKSMACAVAGTVTAVEVSKERKQLCRSWNPKNQLQHQNVINNVGSPAAGYTTQMERPSSSSSSSTNSSRMASNSNRRETQEMRNQSEESLRTIMYLSCWGPN